MVSCALGFGAFIRLEQVNLSSCGFGSWKTCSKEFVQGLFFHHLAGSGPPKTPAREIDQGIFYSSYLFSFKPSESTFAPLEAGILQCTWERFSPVAVLRCCPAKPVARATLRCWPCLWHSAPLSPIISGKEFVPSSGSKKSALFWAVTMFCHSTFLIRDKALGQLRWTVEDFECQQTYFIIAPKTGSKKW